ncbi:MAG: SpoIIE family protein phosphatase [Bacteroidia bacterium]|nr:SpoIIE family protein phosphatase [Bacteroidia bacterium]
MRTTRLPFAFRLFFLLICAGCVQAQDLKFYHLTTKQGLSQTVINCMIKDSRGFMWFGTQDGLNRYDGYTFTVFRNDPEDTNSISDNYINCLLEDQEGRIWIGTNVGGLNVYDPVLNRFVRYRHEENNDQSLSDNKVFCIMAAPGGGFVVGTDNGLNFFDGESNRFRRYLAEDTPKALIDASIRCLATDEKDNIWVGTFRGGLHRFRAQEGVFDYFSPVEQQIPGAVDKSEKIRTIYCDKDGLFWIGTYNGGTFLFDPLKEKYLKCFLADSGPEGITHNWVLSFAEDKRGMIWVATNDSGLCFYNKSTGKFTRQYSDEFDPLGLSSNSLSSLLCDETGNMWVGTSTNGVNVFFRNTLKFSHVRRRVGSENTLPDKIIYCVYKDKSNQVWFCAKGAELSKLDLQTGKFTHYKDVCEAQNKTILTIYESPNGLFYLGSYGGGISIFDPGQGRAVPIRDDEFKGEKLTNKTILNIRADKLGHLWISTFGGGLFRFDPVNYGLEVLNVSKGLAHNRVHYSYQASDGLIWVATQGGISVVDPLTFKVIRNYKAGNSDSSITSNTVYSFYQDRQGNIWVATGIGLNRISAGDGKIQKFYQKDGMANDNIYGILEDKKGNLWLSTNKGITRFNPGTKNINGSAFKNYEAIDGLAEGEYLQGSFFKDAVTDELYFGGNDGFNTFLPEKIEENEHIPPVFITSFKRFGKEVQLDTNILYKRFIELSYRDNFFSFEFVSLDYTLPGKNLYSYKMEGVDEDWSAPSTIRYASYTNLEGGDYVFRVRASNNDGVWNEAGAVIHIRVIPPVYKTKTFYAICVILLLIGIWSFTKWRTRAIEKEKKLLEDKVAERTAELAQKNLDIMSSIQYAKRIQEAILPEMKEIRKHLPDSFVLFKPKDIVSGDFYWFGTKGGKKIIAAVDCTGHGVPGAFMSMIGNNLLSQIVMEKGITDPGLILNELNAGVRAALRQGIHEVDTKDGMDVALCVINPETREVQFSGAFRPLVIVHEGKLEKVDGTKFPIGGSQMDNERVFTTSARTMEKGDTLYMFSDGYADQFGGERGKKFMLKKLNELFLAIQELGMNRQKEELDQTIETWRGHHEQVDDILIIGVRL